MRKILSLLTIVASSVALALPADATVVVAAAGTARYGHGACFTMAGGTVSPGNGQLPRNRWGTAYFDPPQTSLPAGACNELDDHVDILFSCATSPGRTSPTDPTVLTASGTGTDGKKYVVKVVDGGPGGVDRVGIVQMTPPAGAPLCGAGDVETAAVTDGGYVISAA